LNMWVGERVEKVTCRQAVERGLVSSWLVAYYLWLVQDFYFRLGISSDRLRFRRLGDDEKAFYAAEAWDLEVLTSTGWVELVACNNRTDYDLGGHQRVSGVDLRITEDGESFLPHVFELSMGVDRSLLALLELGFVEENGRSVLHLHPFIAPYTVAVFPLLDKPELTQVAQRVHAMLKLDFDTFYDEKGSIGRRYRRQDEIGTPFCVTVDYQTLEDDTVTVRDRDTMKQERVKIGEIKNYLSAKLVV
ncbi:MAG: glycine--tRNA ligase, partial [Candidatus Freyarchaeota archaeon]|nr:glycine--tRNA ligase [Candidatus Jordarchaeia archaeon]